MNRHPSPHPSLVAVPLSALLSVLLSAAGCGDDGAPASPVDGGTPDAGTPPMADADLPTDAGPPAPIEWGPCPAGFLTECATLAMPLDHEDPGGETLDVHISRAGEGERHLWLLQGGPGGSAAGLLPFVSLFRMLDSSLAVYTIEHRGVGLSTRLGCSAEDAASPEGLAITAEEAPDCLAELEDTWGDSLALFSTTQAAHDLASAIGRTGDGAEEVFVWGGSYGAYWAHRYALLYPDQPAGVLLDAAVQPGASLARFPTQYDPVGRELLAEHCTAEPVCAEKLGSDPVAFAEDLVTALEGGHCAELGPSALEWQNIFGVFLMSYTLREWLPALLYRLDRCDEADRTAVTTLIENLFGGDEGEGSEGMPHYDSALLQTHIVLSELWSEEPVDPEAIAAEVEDAIFRQDAVGLGYALQDVWPTYPEPADAFAPPSVPMLVTVGGLDPAAPPETYAERYRDELTGEHQHYVEIPYAAHSVLVSGPVPGALPCPMQLFQAFVRDPRGELPTDCVDDVVPPRFSTPAGTTAMYWGTADLYENP